MSRPKLPPEKQPIRARVVVPPDSPLFPVLKDAPEPGRKVRILAEIGIAAGGETLERVFEELQLLRQAVEQRPAPEPPPPEEGGGLDTSALESDEWLGKGG